MAIRFYPPGAFLQDVVAHIYVHSNEASVPGDPRWLIVPDGDVKLIFPIAGAIRCRIGDGERLHEPSRLIVSGMRTEPGELSFPKGIDAIGVMLKPGAAYRLLGGSHGEIVNCTFDGEDLFGHRARQLHDELMHARGERHRVDILKQRLYEWLQRCRQRDLTFELAVDRIRRSAGRVRIEDLASAAGLSRRQLERKFQERISIGPKQLADVLRFHRVYKQILANPQASYTGLIQDAYFDQSHFLKAFRRYTGMNPRKYAGTLDYGQIYLPE